MCFVTCVSAHVPKTSRTTKEKKKGGAGLFGARSPSDPLEKCHANYAIEIFAESVNRGNLTLELFTAIHGNWPYECHVINARNNYIIS